MGPKVRTPMSVGHSCSLRCLTKSASQSFSSLPLVLSGHWAFSRPTWVQLSLCDKGSITGILWLPSWRDWPRPVHFLWVLLVNTALHQWFLSTFEASPFIPGLSVALSHGASLGFVYLPLGPWPALLRIGEYTLPCTKGLNFLSWFFLFENRAFLPPTPPKQQQTW